jgi:hypothetical protein
LKIIENIAKYVNELLIPSINENKQDIRNLKDNGEFITKKIGKNFFS